jgi:hypothetical protein
MLAMVRIGVSAAVSPCGDDVVTVTRLLAQVAERMRFWLYVPTTDVAARDDPGKNVN